MVRQMCVAHGRAGEGVKIGVPMQGYRGGLEVQLLPLNFPRQADGSNFVSTV